MTTDTTHTDVHLLADELFIEPRNTAVIYPGFVVRNGVGSGGGRLGFGVSITGDADARHRAADRLRRVADFLDAWTMPEPARETDVASVNG